MPTQSTAHFYLDWAKERIDEMDAALASLETKVAEVQADARTGAEQFIADLHRKRDEFESSAQKQAEAGEAAWEKAKVQLEAEWKGFQAATTEYFETVGKGIEQQQAVFKSQATAQIGAWRETADHLNAAAKQFAAERRRDIDDAVSRMKADATAAEHKLQEFAQAGTQSWSALNAALAETRTVFDRANQAARDAFKRAGSSAQ
jgi:hypothetical protein